MTRPAIVEAVEDSGFEARLERVSLPDLIQMKCLSGTSGGVKVTSGTDVGWLYFSQGTLSHARAGTLVGDAAVLEILKWNAGSCESGPSPGVAVPSVQAPWQNLLMLAAQAHDESSRSAIRPSVSPTSTVRRVPARSEEPHMNVTLKSNQDSIAPTSSAVRLDVNGHTLVGRGNHEELSALAAYACNLGNHVAMSLGLNALRGVEFRAGEQRTVLTVEPSTGEVTAVQSTREVDVAEIKNRAGL